MPTPPSARLPAVRPPKQDRTRESWQRILETGLELLETGGWEALTVSEVCRRCGISAPSLYARVDGRNGLFYAVYEYGMVRVASTQAQLAESVRPGEGLETAARRATEAMLETFERHGALLRAVILRASVDAEFRGRGAIESRIALRGVFEHVPGKRTAVEAAGRTVFSECVVRIIYGADFFTGDPESSEQFVDRLTTLIVGAVTAAGPPIEGEDWPVRQERMGQ
ncbi:MAG: TetR/AcrR family transcriptional regulator [Pseudolysinimonas sp.]|jgi:AcrR family transcriptional regulator|uniref:TetR/AcrR family transcriptional regulator n=1 Tax=Pseudolysinimonas sp. TaxID=2680009 RepID=UPI003C71AC52